MEECSICLLDMQDNTVCKLRCKHKFHAVCVRKHIISQSYAGCPMCRQYIDQIDREKILRKCISNADVSDISEFIKNSSHANTSTPYWGVTPLHYAASRGDVSILEYLVKMGANVNSRASMEHTPLYMAAMYGNKDAVKFLLSSGADPYLGRRGVTPAMIAWQQRHYDLANYISGFT